MEEDFVVDFEDFGYWVVVVGGELFGNVGDGLGV